MEKKTGTITRIVRGKSEYEAKNITLRADTESIVLMRHIL